MLNFIDIWWEFLNLINIELTDSDLYMLINNVWNISNFNWQIKQKSWYDILNFYCKYNSLAKISLCFSSYFIVSYFFGSSFFIFSNLLLIKILFALKKHFSLKYFYVFQKKKIKWKEPKLEMMAIKVEEMNDIAIKCGDESTKIAIILFKEESITNNK